MENKTGTPVILSVVALVIAGIALILGIVSLAKSGSSYGGAAAPDGEFPETDVSIISNVSADDHVRGSKNAEISIIEFSDLECPFCSMVHSTLNQIVNDYNGEVNWIYRHLPLDQIHANAVPAAIASECIAKLGGNDAFWSFIDTIFEKQDQMGNQLYEDTAVSLGISKTAFATCLDSQETLDAVGRDASEAIEANILGTPFSIIISGGEKIPISGAQPYEAFQSIIEELK